MATIRPVKLRDNRLKTTRTVRVALAQLDYNPTYKYKIDFIIEPLFEFANVDNALSTLNIADTGIKLQYTSLIKTLKDSYIRVMLAKTKKIIERSKSEGAELVVFPEYSIPLDVALQIIKSNPEVSLVMPSHIVTEETLTKLEAAFETEIKPQQRQALYLAYNHNDRGIFVLPKVTQSQFETQLNIGQETRTITLTEDEFEIAVAMCSDFLQGRLISVPGSGNPFLQILSSADLRIVCSFTPSTQPFFDMASLDLLRTWSNDRRPTLFVNHLSGGGTSSFCRMAKEQVLDKIDDVSSYRLPPWAEAIVIFDVPLGPQPHGKPSPYDPEPAGSIYAMTLLDDPWNGKLDPESKIAEQRQLKAAANEIVSGNINRALALLQDVAGLEERFERLAMPDDASLDSWRVHVCNEVLDFLQSVSPSLSASDRRNIVTRIAALHELIGYGEPSAPQNEKTKKSQGFKKTTPEPVEKTIVFKKNREGIDYDCAAFRLQSIPKDRVPIARYVTALLTLFDALHRVDGMFIGLDFLIAEGGQLGVNTALHNITIEILINISVNYSSGNAEERRNILNDCGFLLHTGLGDSYRFRPMTEQLWDRYYSPAGSYRSNAYHAMIDDQLVPYSPPGEINQIVGYLYSRGTPTLLSIAITRADPTLAIKWYSFSSDKDQVQYALDLGKEPEGLIQNEELFHLLRSDQPQELENRNFEFQVSLYSEQQQNRVFVDAVMRRLLGNNFAIRQETKIDDSWRLASNESPDLSPVCKVGSLKEALMLFRFPTGSLPSFGDRTSSGVFQVPIEVAERSEGVLIGRGFHTDVPDGVPIFMPLADRHKHTYVIGKTGVGKTQFLLNMIMQDIIGGFGVCVIDPHGDLYDDVLSRYPKSRIDDLVVFDPADPLNPPGLNVFEHDRRNLLERDFVLDEIVSIFLKLFGKEIFGPRLQNYFRNGAMALMNDPSKDRTLLDIARLFIDDDFFDYIMRSVSDPSVKDFIEEFRKTATREREEMIPYFQSKFTPFVSNRVVRSVIGQPKSTVNFKSAMDQNKVVLINLSKGKLGELNSRLLGMVLISKLAWSALSRANMPPAQRREFFLFCDEFQSFATESFLVILSEARKYGLCLTVANQYIKQLQITDNYTHLDRDSLRDAVFGNVANLIAFRAGAGDAEELAKQLGVNSESFDVWKTQLMNQPAFHAIVKLDCEGVSTYPFSLQTIRFDQLNQLNGQQKAPTDADRGLGEKVGRCAKMMHQLPVELIDWETKKSRTDFYRLKGKLRRV
jgi:hypothetical protein